MHESGITEDELVNRRFEMVRTIEAEVKDTRYYLGKDQLSASVIKAMQEVPRHEFIGSGNQTYAYYNEPLSIGHGQTISQPYIVAIMSDLIAPEKTHRVLDIGTGSGYQAAVLSRLVETVYSVEIIEALSQNAAECFTKLSYDNIHLKVGDGRQGWLEHAPYDGIVVAAATTYIPVALTQQLKPGGKLILPLGSTYHTQELVLVEKGPDETLSTRNILPVAFVPLVGDSE